MAKIYDFKALTSKGKEIDFSQFQGKVLLIVNTASKCGFTPQFAGLEELNQKYKDKGLVIIGFPCNQFKEQDPGSDEQIEEFCQLNYGVTFQIMKKTDVNGPAAEPIFEYLKSQAPTEEYNGLKAKAAKALFKTISKSVEKDSDIKWNFTKFLISKDGETIKRYGRRKFSLTRITANYPRIIMNELYEKLYGNSCSNKKLCTQNYNLTIRFASVFIRQHDWSHRLIHHCLAHWVSPIRNILCC